MIALPWKGQSFSVMARTKDFDENEVMTRAMELFWLKGYNATSMQDLVDGLGISRSSLYDTYGDKHSLFIRSLENYEAIAGGKIAGIVDNAPSAKAAVRSMLEYITDELLADREHKGCFLVNVAVEVASQDKEVSNIVCENDRRVEEFFYAAIKKGLDSGEIKNKQDARALARFVFNNVKGIRVAARSTSDKAFFDDIIELTMSVLN